MGKSHRTFDRFTENNDEWLKTSIAFQMYEHEQPTERKESARGRGRPELPFLESSERSKRKKTQEIRKRTPLHELTYATQMSLRSSGQTEAAKLIKEVTETTPTRAKKFRKAMNIYNKTKLMSGEEALALYVEAKLTQHQYNLIRAQDKERFPSYKVLQITKKGCYPNVDNRKITATSAEVSMQDLLDHTAERVIEVQKDVISTLPKELLKDMHLISKWGFDGSSGHSSYKQRFSDPNLDDSSVFISSLVPLRMLTNSNLNYHDPKAVIWQNPRPSSTRFCRPIKINFTKETTEHSMAEKNRIDCELSNLKPTSINFGDEILQIRHILIFSMVDGKICNALTDTKSTQKCFICGATSKQFNNIDDCLSRDINDSNLQFWLSTLHSWIRFFECILHIGYRMPIKKWQARGTDNALVETNKKRIQNLFREKLGLIVDKPKPGFGCSNDGNTARRFFENAEVSSEITEVDVTLIKRFHTILITISSGYDINLEKFRSFALNTAKHFVNQYPWYIMPPTVHKVLIHGPEVISSALLPIGQLSEEAQEARNKDFKKFRESFSRKCSREKCNEDILNLLLVTSDPVISSIRQLPRKKIRRYPNEVLELIEAPDVTIKTSEEIQSDLLEADSDDSNMESDLEAASTEESLSSDE